VLLDKVRERHLAVVRHEFAHEAMLDAPWDVIRRTSPTNQQFSRVVDLPKQPASPVAYFDTAPEAG
jgi:hypothetical protein